MMYYKWTNCLRKKKPQEIEVFLCIYRKYIFMSKLSDFIANPLNGLKVGAVFFGIALINSLLVDASSYSDLSWWGKGATIGFMVVLGVLLVRNLVIPVGYTLLKFLKIVK